jgi:hypothetical protein
MTELQGRRVRSAAFQVRVQQLQANRTSKPAGWTVPQGGLCTSGLSLCPYQDALTLLSRLHRSMGHRQQPGQGGNCQGHDCLLHVAPGHHQTAQRAPATLQTTTRSAQETACRVQGTRECMHKKTGDCMHRQPKPATAPKTSWRADALAMLVPARCCHDAVMPALSPSHSTVATQWLTCTG